MRSLTILPSHLDEKTRSSPRENIKLMPITSQHPSVFREGWEVKSLSRVNIRKKWMLSTRDALVRCTTRIGKTYFPTLDLIENNVKQIFAVCSTSDIFHCHCIDIVCSLSLPTIRTTHFAWTHEFIDAKVEWTLAQTGKTNFLQFPLDTWKKTQFSRMRYHGATFIKSPFQAVIYLLFPFTGESFVLYLSGHLRRDKLEKIWRKVPSEQKNCLQSIGVARKAFQRRFPFNQTNGRTNEHRRDEANLMAQENPFANNVW